jgi:hypothetical protein
MAEWLVGLKGDKAELEYLCKLSSQSWIVIEEDGTYYLKSTRFNAVADAFNVRADASKIIDSMNGVARLVFHKFDGAKVGGIIRVESNGKPPTQYLMPSGILSAERVGIPATTVSGFGQKASQPFSIPELRWIEVAQKDMQVNKALALYGRLEPNWRNLYMVLETIEDDVGGEIELTKKGLAPEGKIKLFKRTANNFLVLGHEARHSTERFKTPPKPMPLEEAQSLIKRILKKWLSLKHK